MTRTFWLSFVDPTRSEGERFLGVCVVDVDEGDVAAEKAVIDALFPQHHEGAEWIAVATRKAWSLGCNPGGEVGVCEIPSSTAIPRGRLLVGDELARWTKEPVH